ncbi:MAG: HD domain-containing protein [Pseudomonadota bacterium]
MSSPCYGPRFDEALQLAAEAFRGSRRKGSDVPYIAHLLWVAATVADHGGDEELIIAALLHDYLEDIRGASAADLADRFGPRVADLVVHLSDSTAQPRPPWRERKERYLAQLPSAPAEVKLVSAADKLHNVSCCVRDYRQVGEALWGRFRGGREGTLWYFRQVHLALAMGWAHTLVDELGARVHELHQLTGAASPPSVTS